MNNNQMNFDPMTGQPINQNIATIPNQVQTNNAQIVQQVQPDDNQTNQSVQQTTNNINVQQQLQSIPTVDQTKQEFINNTQAENIVKKEEKQDGPNIVFIIILFVIIFAAIFFLFPYLMKVL